MAGSFRFLIGILLILPNLRAEAGWTLKDDSANLGIFILDYQTRAFEEGHFTTYNLCRDCDRDSIPLTFEYQAPGDFGGIDFFYQADTVLKATIIWMGMGSISFPDKFTPADSFLRHRSIAPDPVSVRLIKADLVDITETEADEAWNSISNLAVLKAFAQHGYHVGMYLYPPTVGAFDPSAAKILVFVYRGRDWWGSGVIADGSWGATVQKEDAVMFDLRGKRVGPLMPAQGIFLEKTATSEIKVRLKTY